MSALLAVVSCAGCVSPPVALAPPVVLVPGAVRPPATTALPAVPSGSACTLVTAAEVSKAGGQPMRVSADGGPTGMCIFSAVSDASFTLYVEIDRSAVDIQNLEQQLESESTHITGLGEDAFWNAAIGELVVQTGGRALVLILPSLADLTGRAPESEQRMTALAVQALARF